MTTNHSPQATTRESRFRAVMRHSDEWGANCGPVSFAVILGLSLDRTREIFEHFRFPGFTNPTLMRNAIEWAGVGYKILSGRTLPADPWPTWGLARIQWEGPWTRPGVPPRVAYRHTHWVGARYTDDFGTDVFDVNAIGDDNDNHDGWISLKEWREQMVPFLTEDIKGATGGWRVTHRIEVGREEDGPPIDNTGH